MTEPSRRRGPLGFVSKIWNAFDGLAGDTLWGISHDFANLVTALTSFELLQVALGLETYGAYLGLYGLIGAFGAASYSGPALSLLQRLLGEGDDPNRSLRSYLSLVLIGGVAGALIVVVVGLASLRLTWQEIALVATAELLAAGVIFLAAVLVQAASGYPASVRVRLGVIAVRLITLVTLALTDRLTIANLALGFLVGFALYALYLLVRHLPRHGYDVSVGRPTGQSLRSSSLFSIPMGASKLQTDADKWFLNVYRFDADAGLYGAAYRIVLLGTLPLVALDAAAFQRFLPQSEGERGLHWRRAVRLASLMVVASVAVAGLIYLALPILDFLFAEDFKDAVDIVPWLLLLIPLIATSSTPLNGLLGLGQADKRMYVYLSSAFVSIVLYMTLIPAYSWRGAVVATAVSEVYLVATGWLALWYFQRKADEELDRRDADGQVMSRA